MKIRKVLKSFSVSKQISGISKVIANEDQVSRLHNTKTLYMWRIVQSYFVVHFLSAHRIVFSLFEDRGHYFCLREI